MKNSCEGILYPIDSANECKAILESEKKDSTIALPSFVQIPHSAWQSSFSTIAKSLSPFKGKSIENVFVLAPLHKGPIDYDDEFCVYTPSDGSLEGSDWKISLKAIKDPIAKQDDDVCTEEHALEIVAPFLSVLFPKAQVSFLLAPDFNEQLVVFVKSILENYPNSLFLISNNTDKNCCAMWIRALRENGVAI